MASIFGRGLARINKKLTNDIPDKATKAATQALITSAHEIAELQYALAPVDDGDLRNSIEVTPPGSMTPQYSQPGGQQMAAFGQAFITAGNTRVRYAHLVEHGTAPHDNAGLYAGTRHPGTAAQPFFFPAWRALRKRAKSRIANAIAKAVRDGAK